MRTFDPSLSPGEQADRLVEAAWNLFRMDRYDQAIETAQRALACHPESGAARRLLSYCYTMRSQYDKAKHWAVEAIGVEPDHAWSHHAVSFAYFHDTTWHSDAAESLIDDANRYGFRRKKQLNEAFAACDEAIRLDPTESSFHEHKARMWLRLKRYAEALAAADLALQFDPQSSDAQTIRADAMLALGRKPDALHAAGRAVAADPDAAQAHLARGRALQEAGDVEGARVHFAEAVRLDPASDHVKAQYLDHLRCSSALYRRVLRKLNGFAGDFLGAAGAMAAAVTTVQLLISGRVIDGPPHRTHLRLTGAELTGLLLLLAIAWAGMLGGWFGRTLAERRLLRDPLGQSMLDRTDRVRIHAVSIATLTALVVSAIAAAAAAWRTLAS